MTVATVRASVQFFPLRQGDKTHPEVRKMFPETHENSEKLSKWMDVAKLLNKKLKIVKTGSEKNHEHYRLVDGATKNRHLGQICCIDNKDTGTQASIWCDSKHKQVIIVRSWSISVMKAHNCSHPLVVIGTDDNT